MNIHESAQEALEKLWIETIEGKEKSINADALAKTTALKELSRAKYVTISGDRVELTAEGYPEAQKITRRHRLAERLLHDVLNVSAEDMETTACKFEHVLSEGVEESICVLLGHPSICPHGKPIPTGNCCQEGRLTADRVVSSLSRLREGQHGEIVYILTKSHDNLPKLLAMGILPGHPIEIIQTFPTYVFQVDQTQIAVDSSIADDIFVRLK